MVFDYFFNMAFLRHFFFITIVLLTVVFECFGHTGLERINFKDSLGRKQGTWEYVYHSRDKRIIEKGKYVNGLKEGLWEKWEKGYLREKWNYKGNVKNGEFYSYHLNGKMRTKGAFLNGRFHSSLTGFDSTGNVIAKQVWENGELIKSKYTNPEAKPTPASADVPSVLE